MVKGLILMGGQSTRMGQDKAEVMWQGQQLIQHQVKLLTSVVDTFYLSVNNGQLVQYQEQYNCIEDIYPRIGPIGGIASALKATRDDLLIIPVDMPLINPEILRRLIENKRNGCYLLDEQLEPFPSYWTFDTLPALLNSIEKEEYSLTRLMKSLEFHQEPIDRLEQFKNMNTPSDLI